MSNSYYIRRAAICGFRDKQTKTDDHTVAFADEGAWLAMNKASAVTVSLPNDSTANLAIGTKLLISKEGAGDVTIAADVGATLNAPTDTTRISNQYEGLEVMKVAADTWRLFSENPEQAVSEAQQYGQIYVRGGSTTQVTNGTPGTYETMSGWNTAAGANGDSSSGVTPDKANNKMTIVDTGLYEVHFSCSFQGATNITYTLRASLDGTPQDQLYLQRKTSNADVGDCGFSGIIDVDSASEDLIIEVTGSGGSDNFTPVDAQLVILKLGET